MTPAELIGRSLECVGIDHVIETNSGRPAGVFTMARLKLQTTVMIQGDWLDIRLRRVIPGPVHESHLRRFAMVSCESRFSRVYFNAEDNHYEAALGLDVSDGVPPPEALRAAFRHLGNAAQALRAFDRSPFTPPPSPAHLAQVKSVLGELGIPFFEADASVGWGVTEVSGTRYSIQLQIVDALLIVRGIHPVPLQADRGLLDKLQSLNARLAAGTVQLDLETLRLYYELTIPLAWWPLSPARMRRWLDQTRAVMLQVEPVITSL